VSSTLLGPFAGPVREGHAPDVATAREPARSGAGVRDTSVIAGLAVCFAALTALTWRRWGVPEIDAGAELTTADLVEVVVLAMIIGLLLCGATSFLTLRRYLRV